MNDLHIDIFNYVENCQPEVMPLEKTVGYVVHTSVIHGKCTNVEPVHELTECVGHCQSRTVHEPGKDERFDFPDWI